MISGEISSEASLPFFLIAFFAPLNSFQQKKSTILKILKSAFNITYITYTIHQSFSGEVKLIINSSTCSQKCKPFSFESNLEAHLF